MSTRTLLVVALALAFGVSVVVGLNSLRVQPGSAPPAETVPVVAAAVDIPRGRALAPGMLRTVEWPKDRVPAGATGRAEDLLDRVCYIPLLGGKPVLEGKLVPRGAGRGMGALTRPGMRSFTIPTPSVASGVAGFILPGDRVDVLLTVTDGGEAFGGGTTTTLLQNVEILAVDQRVDAPANAGVGIDLKDLRSVTLQVTPEGAAQLALGQNKGTLQLSLRNPQDDKLADTPRATLAALRTTPSQPAAEAPRPRPVRPAVLYLRTMRAGIEGRVGIVAGHPQEVPDEPGEPN